MEKKLCLLITYLVLVVFPTQAFAYLDPGTGSMILQGIAAAFFGVLFFSKRIIASVKGFFGKDKIDASGPHQNDMEE